MRSVESPTLSVPTSTTAKSLVVSRFADYLELTKPRIATLALVTVTIGYMLGSAGEWQAIPLLHALLGIGLVAASSSAINQWWERYTDQRMKRTENRPLPAGRLSPSEVLTFGIVTGIVGVAYLIIAVNLLCAILALTTLVLYAGIYTPLKRYTSFCTAIGAIPGALPPVLGWVAATNSLSNEAFALFGILYMWQFPHFLAICWLYQDDYADAGLRMLPAMKPSPGITGWLCVAYAVALIPVSLLPSHLAMAGDRYLFVAVLLGLAYLYSAFRFLRNESATTARQLIYTSLVYLPLLLLMLTWDHWQLLQ